MFNKYNGKNGDENERPASWMFILNTWLAALLFIGVFLLGTVIWLSLRAHHDRTVLERRTEMLDRLLAVRDGLNDWYLALVQRATDLPPAPDQLWYIWLTGDHHKPEHWPRGTFPEVDLASFEPDISQRIKQLSEQWSMIRTLAAAERAAAIAALAAPALDTSRRVNKAAQNLRVNFFQNAEQRDPQRVLFPILTFGSCLLVALLMVISALYRRDLVKLQQRSQALAVANVALANEIRSRQRAQSSLAKQEENYRRFFEESLSANYISTPDGKLLACNRMFAQIFGFDSVAEALSCNLNDLYPARPDRQSFVERLQLEGKIEGLEAELRRKDGKPVFVIENVIGEFEGDKLVKIRGYLIDNTRRKYLEQQLIQAGKLDAVGRVTSGIAHDFNNMLTAILGYSNMLLEEVRPDQPALREGLQEIIKASERSAGLVRRLLAFSRSQVVVPRMLNLNSVVQDAEKLMRLLIGERIEIILELEPAVGQVRADPGQLESVILNMALNARDAMPTGGKLVVRTSLSPPPSHAELTPPPGTPPANCYAVLSIIDNGEGMDDHVRSHLFEPFFTTKAAGQGTGLGLASAAEIIRRSQGYVQVESRLGKGTAFHVYLPRVAEGVVPETQPLSAPLEPRPIGLGRTVLLVEDEESVRAFAARVLQMRGFNVLTASHGAEALQLANNLTEPLHALVTDVVMPHLNGPDLARDLVAKRKDLKVLFMTGYAKGTGSGFLPALKGNQDLIRKPFTPEALIDKLEALFSRAENPLHRKSSA